MDKSDALWKTIQRFDFYASSSQSKSAAILTLNGFLAGAISLKATEIAALIGTFGNQKWPQPLAFIIVMIITIGTCLSSVYSIRSLTPKRNSTSEPSHYTSLFFFMDVASKNDPSSYIQQVGVVDDKELFDDLARQVHSMATVVKEKYDDLEKAVWCLLRLQIVPLGLLISLKLIVACGRYLLM